MTFIFQIQLAAEINGGNEQLNEYWFKCYSLVGLQDGLERCWTDSVNFFCLKKTHGVPLSDATIVIRPLMGFTNIVTDKKEENTRRD